MSAQLRTTGPSHLVTVDAGAIAAGRALRDGYRRRLIGALRATKRCPFTDAQLEATPDEELEQLVTMAGVPLPAMPRLSREQQAQLHRLIEPEIPMPSLTAAIARHQGTPAPAAEPRPGEGRSGYHVAHGCVEAPPDAIVHAIRRHQGSRG